MILCYSYLLYSVNCRWSLWTTCKPCKKGNQQRKITRQQGCNSNGECGTDCEDKELTKRPCLFLEKCGEDAESK